MAYLPNDIVLDIFSRLPAKSISRFRCVSKSFNALSQDPYFVRTHLHRSINHRDPSGFLMYLPLLIPYHKFQYYSILSPETDIHNEIGRERRRNCLPFPPDHKNEYDCGLRLVGSCDGLICLASEEFFVESQCAIHIWNPSLHQHITLPPYSVPCHRIDLFLGFGFDATADDYKVVKIVYNDLRSDWSDIEVYRVKKGGWEIIRQVVPSHILYMYSCGGGLNLNGSVHWLADRAAGPESMQPIIVQSDLAHETFGDISLPNGVADYSLQPCVFKGQLALFSFTLCPYGTHNFCDLWVMKGYGDHRSWVKEYAIRLDALPCAIRSPIGFTPIGEFFLKSVDEHLISYDPKSGQVKDFGIPANAYSIESCFVTCYVDSLVSLASKSYGSGK